MPRCPWKPLERFLWYNQNTDHLDTSSKLLCVAFRRELRKPICATQEKGLWSRSSGLSSTVPALLLGPLLAPLPFFAFGVREQDLARSWSAEGGCRAEKCLRISCAS